MVRGLSIYKLVPLAVTPGTNRFTGLGISSPHLLKYSWASYAFTHLPSIYKPRHSHLLCHREFAASSYHRPDPASGPIDGWLPYYKIPCSHVRDELVHQLKQTFATCPRVLEGMLHSNDRIYMPLHTFSLITRTQRQSR